VFDLIAIIAIVLYLTRKKWYNASKAKGQIKKKRRRR
jgi:hypothetical protein